MLFKKYDEIFYFYVDFLSDFIHVSVFFKKKFKFIRTFNKIPFNFKNFLLDVITVMNRPLHIELMLWERRRNLITFV